MQPSPKIWYILIWIREGINPFEMFPLTFDEYIGMKRFLGKDRETDTALEFEKYITEGGFPKTLDFHDLEDKRSYVRGVITEIFEKDIKKRVKICTLMFRLR